MRYNVLFLFVVVALISCEKENKHTSLLGVWNCQEFPEQTAPRTYQVSISRNNFMSDASNQYKISNFYQLGNAEDAEVYFYQDSLTDELIIMPQTVRGTTFHGKGTVTEDFSEINWEYYANSGNINEKVIATYY